MRAMKVGFLALLLLGALSAQVWAITPFNPTVDESEDMEHDTDGYTPTDANPADDPPLGDTPGAGPAHLGGPPEFIAGQDWFDMRNGGSPGHVIEEVPSGYLGVATPVGSYQGHIAAPHSAAHHAVLRFAGGDGPFGRTNRQVSNPVPAAPFSGSRTGYWATSDLYIDPAKPYGGADGLPDFWWTNAVNSVFFATYMTEAGMTATVDPPVFPAVVPTTWSIHTTAGALLGVVPVGSWIGWEVEPVRRLADDGIDFEHRLYADGGTHSTLIGTVTSAAAFTGAGSFFDLGGPRYNWYTFPDPDNMNDAIIHVDNVGWAAVPEPSTLVLAGMGAIGLVYAARRRRRLA